MFSIQLGRLDQLHAIVILGSVQARNSRSVSLSRLLMKEWADCSDSEVSAIGRCRSASVA